MKLRTDNHIELSVANLKALLQEVERKQSQGRTAEAMIYRGVDFDGKRVTVAVSVVPDEVHYTEAELAERKSPYLAPEAWAGVL